MRKVGYITGTRAEFGLMEKILTGIPHLVLLATGMHLLKEFGGTINEVKAKFPQTKIIDATYAEDSRLSMARFLGRAVSGITEVLATEKPELILVLGDRAEQLAMAEAAAYLAIPVIHLHGGEVTKTIDNKARNAISQLADWHLPASQGAAEKLNKMGIDKTKILIVGAPGLDQISDLAKTEKKDYLVVLQHPDENENEAAWQIKETLEAVLTFNLPTVVIYPNADAGGRAMIKVIDAYKNKLKIYPSLERAEFLRLLTRAKVLIGNSSCGLIEAPNLKLPFVNVEPRQTGRERGNNVIDCDYGRKNVAAAINQALTLKINRVINPYGDGQTTARVIKFLNSL